MVCKVCGAKKERLLLKCRDMDFPSKAVELFECESCFAVFVRPQPTPKQMAPYYFQEYYNKPSFILKIIQSLRPNFFNGLKPGRLLDVGCGSGHFLETMQKKDWKCSGSEVSASSKQFLQELTKKGIQVKYGNLPEISFPAESFDLITFWHVLEHVPFPSDELAVSRKLLAKNGRIFIAVPNIQSASFKLFKCNWFHLDAPRHQNHFSPKSLSLLLGKNGFVVEKISHYSFEFNPFGLLQSLYNGLGFEYNFLHHLIKRQPMKKNPRYWLRLVLTVVFLPVLVPLCVAFAYIFSFFGFGDTIQVLAKKKPVSVNF
ncbi:MAG: class I SAM-dependent methyltransferase [Candidatus Micrarchaeota archaeon]